jgi:WD40 repeat protein
MRWPTGTPRGTWLLASLLWLAGSAVLWWWLPVRPRAEWVCPQQVWVGYIPNRRTFVTTSFQLDGPFRGPLRFWEADSGKVIDWFAGESMDPDVALSPDGSLVAVRHGGTEHSERFRLYDTATGRIAADLPFSAESSLYGLCFSADSRWFAYSKKDYADQWVCVWDVNAGRVRCTLRSDDGLLKMRPNHRLAFAPDGQTLAVADCVGGPKTKDVTRVQLWDWDHGRLNRAFDGPASEGCCRLEFSPDGRHVLAQFDIRGPRGESRWQVWCWDVADGRQTMVISGEIAAIAPDRLWVYALNPVSLQCTLQVREFAGGMVKELDLNPNLSPDCRTAVIASHEPHPIRDWITARGIRWPFSEPEYVRGQLVDVATNRVIGQLPAWPDLAECRPFGWVGISSDGRLYAEQIDFGLRIWDVPPRKPLLWFLAGSAILAILLARQARRRIQALLRTV